MPPQSRPRHFLGDVLLSKLPDIARHDAGVAGGSLYFDPQAAVLLGLVST
jgi:hypothetical protein